MPFLMIDILTQRIIFGDRDEKIRAWVVWWKTPLGLYKSLQEAVDGMTAHQIDPIVSIIPVSVAITDSMQEVWSR